jgi:hypothetical protein
MPTAVMREVTFVCLYCAVVPIFALLKGNPQAKWREFLLKDSHEDLSSQQVKQTLMFQPTITEDETT